MVFYSELAVSLKRTDIENYKLSLDNRGKEDSKSKQNNIPIDEEPVKKKQNLERNGTDNLKLKFRDSETHQFKSKVKSLLKPNKEIASTSNEEIPVIIDFAESTESTCAVPEVSTSGLKGYLLPTKASGNKQLLNAKHRVKWNLTEIEKLHNKYFSKSVQDTIVIIANILHVILISNKHLMDESTKKAETTEDKSYKKYKKILEKNLKNKFIDVTSTFEEAKFYAAFAMFYLSILTVFRVFDQPKFRNCSELFDVVFTLLPESLKNDQYQNKNFLTFQSRPFFSDCICNLPIAIYDSRDTDPGVTDHMPLYFLRTANSLEYFKAVINAVTSDSNKDLSLLIENPTFQCYNDLDVKDPVNSSTVQHLNHSTPVTETIQSSINSDETNQHWVLANNKNLPNRDKTVQNGSKYQVIGNTVVKPSIVKNQPLTSFNKAHSSSLHKKSSKVIPIKTPTTIFNTPLGLLTSSSSATATSTTSKSVNGPSDQLRVVGNGNSMSVPPTINIYSCEEGHCVNFATMMCSCRKVNYCSNHCGAQHWGVHKPDMAHSRLDLKHYIT